MRRMFGLVGGKLNKGGQIPTSASSARKEKNRWQERINAELKKERKIKQLAS